MLILDNENKKWADYNGKLVIYKNIKHRVEVHMKEEYNHIYIEVRLVPINKYTKYYKRMCKKIGGDGWFIDLLNSECHLISRIWNQLEAQVEPQK